MASQGIHVLTYRQQREYEYEYILGSFQSNLSVADLDLNTDTNATVLTTNTSRLIAITWDSFTQFVDTTLADEQTLYITQYSSRICVNKETNATEINNCFRDWFVSNNRTESPLPEYFIYTRLD
eukprot:448519_1